MNNTAISVREQIKTAIKQQGRKIRWIADQAGCTDAHVYAYLRGGEMRESRVQDIAQALGIEIHRFLFKTN